MGLAGKNILVTGGAGFIGSHLVKHLVDKGARIVVPFIEIDSKSYFKSYSLHKKTALVRCDLRDFDKTLKLIKNHKVDFIFHLAAQATVGTALKNPLETFQSNIMGTVNVLEAARNYGKARGIIVTSSDKAYGKIPRAKETIPVSGDHPYETSKSSADLIARTYFKTYNLPIVVTRFGNVYGEGDLNFSRIVPGIMKSAILSRTLILRSNGKYVRDYVYAEDVTDALILLSEQIKGICGEVFNISSWENLSVLALIKKIEGILNKKIQYSVESSAVNEIPVQSINFSKIKNRLGWRPKSSLKTAIGSIFRWYKDYFS